MTKDQINYQISLLRSQKDKLNANYLIYMVNVYNYYLSKCNKNNSNWCYCSECKEQEMYKLIKVGAHNPDVSFSACRRYMKEIHDLGYVKKKLVDGIWREYIVKELDF